LDDLNVEHDPAARQFRATVEGQVAVLDYSRGPDVLHLLHVGVPVPVRNRGIAARITRTALEYARAEGLGVVPICPYVDAYIRRNPEYRVLVRDPE